MTDISPSARHRVDLQPVGRRVEIAAGDTLLDATRSAGVDLVALCGGEGWCYSCLVRLINGSTSEPSLVELDAISPAQLAEGYRLACQTVPLGDVKVDIPPESLTTPQRLSIEGREMAFELDPLVISLDVSLSAPTSHDLTADAKRLTNACIAQGVEPVNIASEVLMDLSSKLREQEWQARLAVRRTKDGGQETNEIVSVLRPGTQLRGLAVDIGTTKIAAYLVDLATGETLAKAGTMNPQIAYGEDVISRIGYCNEHDDGRTVLQARLVQALNTLVEQLCHEASANPEQIVDAVVVGNTAIHHLFTGLPVRQLVMAPYIAAASDALEFRARDLGLALAPGAKVYLPPNIAGFVGADHVAMALATKAWEEPKRCVVALDIGTNTEVTLTKDGQIWCCSCASGPAFEGAHIEDGMRAAPGAIERVQIASGQPHLKTIGDEPPVGICGSGIVDIVSELQRTGIIDKRGVFQTDAPHVGSRGGLAFYTLVPASATGHGRDIVVTRKDITEVQLAKAAIRSGIDVLINEAGISYDAIDAFIIAGAFGAYLDVNSCTRIGMFPTLPAERYHQVGNAAGTGARQMLLSASRREAAMVLAQKASYVELTIHPEFSKRYLRELRLG